MRYVDAHNTKIHKNVHKTQGKTKQKGMNKCHRAIFESILNDVQMDTQIRINSMQFWASKQDIVVNCSPARPAGQWGSPTRIGGDPSSHQPGEVYGGRASSEPTFFRCNFRIDFDDMSATFWPAKAPKVNPKTSQHPLCGRACILTCSADTHCAVERVRTINGYVWCV